MMIFLAGMAMLVRTIDVIEGQGEAEPRAAGVLARAPPGEQKDGKIAAVEAGTEAAVGVGVAVAVAVAVAAVASAGVVGPA